MLYFASWTPRQVWSAQQEVTVTHRTVNCVTLWCCLARHQKWICFAYEQRLPWCWIEETASWILQELELLIIHISCMVLCIALCGCWQCFLTSPLWHNAVDTFRRFYTLQNVGQDHCIQRDSEQKMSSLNDIALEGITVLMNEGQCTVRLMSLSRDKTF